MLFRMPLHRQMRHGLPLSSRIAPPTTSFWPDGETVRDDGLHPLVSRWHAQVGTTSPARVPNSNPQAVKWQGGDVRKLIEAYPSGWPLQPSQAPSQSFLCPVLGREFRSRSWYSRDEKVLSGVAPQLLASSK
ncbi:hypothetical protein BKA70DRAFT_1402933 [Coprinopsis sp. MPI-PUGE-AT-0042]|nr:hypothetical protein BKA70DRAFT_1402933 [Coprinopsis sp. MPI-PUGE-AT-0042]